MMHPISTGNPANMMRAEEFLKDLEDELFDMDQLPVATEDDDDEDDDDNGFFNDEEKEDFDDINLTSTVEN
jgi:hypothetical protein